MRYKLTVPTLLLVILLTIPTGAHAASVQPVTKSGTKFNTGFPRLSWRFNEEVTEDRVVWQEVYIRVSKTPDTDEQGRLLHPLRVVEIPAKAFYDTDNNIFYDLGLDAADFYEEDRTFPSTAKFRHRLKPGTYYWQMMGSYKDWGPASEESESLPDGEYEYMEPLPPTSFSWSNVRSFSINKTFKTNDFLIIDEDYDSRAYYPTFELSMQTTIPGVPFFLQLTVGRDVLCTMKGQLKHSLTVLASTLEGHSDLAYLQRRCRIPLWVVDRQIIMKMRMGSKSTTGRVITYNTVL
jgi:hypothetical protein